MKCHSVDFRVASVRIAIVFRHGKAKIVRRSEVRYCTTKKASAKHLNKLIARKGKRSKGVCINSFHRMRIYQFRKYLSVSARQGHILTSQTASGTGVGIGEVRGVRI